MTTQTKARVKEAESVRAALWQRASQTLSFLIMTSSSQHPLKEKSDLSFTHSDSLPSSKSVSLSLGSAVCLSLTFDWVEAHVWHASISRETVQLPKLTMFKPCQLLIHLLSKLCIHRAGLLRVMIFPFWHRAVSRPACLQLEWRFILMQCSLVCLQIPV